MKTHSQPSTRKLTLLRSTSIAAVLLLAATSLPSIAAEPGPAAQLADYASAGTRAAREDVDLRLMESSRRSARELGAEFSASETEVTAAFKRELRDDIARQLPALDPAPRAAVASAATLEDGARREPSRVDAAVVHPASNRDAIEHTRVFIAVKEGQSMPGALVQ